MSTERRRRHLHRPHPHRHHPHRRRLAGRGYFRRLGPGLVTGAADDDPSGIGTYSQVGARYGLDFVWVTVAALPLAVAVQEAVARLGITTGSGLAALIRRHLPRRVLYVAVALVVAANSFNIGANLGSMAAATRLLIPVPQTVLVIAFAVAMAALEMFVPYHRYARVLRWLCLSLLSYVAVLAVVDVEWAEVGRRVISPRVSFERDQLAALIAVFGTTISPYLFFWQAGEEVEERLDGGASNSGESAPTDGSEVSDRQLGSMRVDVFAGMFSAVAVMFAIIVTAAVTLHAGGLTSISTAEQAASALEPLAGSGASWLFAAGIVGVGLLSVPVLAGSMAYAIAETFGWREGLGLRVRQAGAFYAVIAGSMALGLVMNLAGLDAVRALYWSAILNGLAAPPLIVMILVLSRRPDVLGNHHSRRLSQAFVAAAAVVSTALPAAYFFAR